MMRGDIVTLFDGTIDTSWQAKRGIRIVPVMGWLQGSARRIGGLVAGPMSGFIRLHRTPAMGELCGII
jgi:hypothetical protein